MRTSLTLAAFEGVMPIVGVFIGLGIGDVVGRFAGYTAAAVIGLAGIILLRPSKKRDKERQKQRLLAHTKGLAIIDLGISISLDELAIGLSLGLLRIPLALVVVFVGIQAFIASQLGLRLGGHLSEKLREKTEQFAGAALIIVAILILFIKLTGHQL